MFTSFWAVDFHVRSILLTFTCFGPKWKFSIQIFISFCVIKRILNYHWSQKEFKLSQSTPAARGIKNYKNFSL